MDNLEEIEKLRIELEDLHVINRILSRRINQLEQNSSATFEAGDRVEANKPTCPGRNRAAIQADTFSIVSIVQEDWMWFVCDSGVKTKIHPINLSPAYLN